MAFIERGCASRRSTLTVYDDDTDDGGSVIQRLKAIDELSEIDAFATGTSEVRRKTSSWDRFDQHIRCIATVADAREQYLKKKSTDKASDTYKAAIREFYDHVDDDDDDFSDSDEELAVFANDVCKEELAVVSRHTPIEISRRNWKGKEGLAAEVGERAASVKGNRERYQTKQQLQTDENASKRMQLYEKYLERDNAWAEGLTKSGREILMEIQKRKKKRSTRFTTFSASNDSRSRAKSASNIGLKGSFVEGVRPKIVNKRSLSDNW